MFLAMAEAGAESKRIYPAGVLETWEQQYQELDRDIKRYQKRGMPLHSKILDRNALILPSDRSPEQIVVLRIGSYSGRIAPAVEVCPE